MSAFFWAFFLARIPTLSSTWASQNGNTTHAHIRDKHERLMRVEHIEDEDGMQVPVSQVVSKTSLGEKGMSTQCKWTNMESFKILQLI